MLFQRLPICGTSGSGIQLGQYTGASIRFASRCQPASCSAFRGSEHDGLLLLRVAPGQPPGGSEHHQADHADGRHDNESHVVECSRAPFAPTN